jgi:hypothetical protein
MSCGLQAVGWTAGVNAACFKTFCVAAVGSLGASVGLSAFAAFVVRPAGRRSDGRGERGCFKKSFRCG